MAGPKDPRLVRQHLLEQSDPDAERAALTARQPTERLASADEVAAAIAYLASPPAIRQLLAQWAPQSRQP